MNKQVSSLTALRQMREHLGRLKKHRPSRKMIPSLLLQLEAIIVILERQELK